MDPKISIWLSVDPLAHKYPSYSPYNFVLNNPVSYQDPNGMWVEDGDGNWIAQEGDSWWTFHEQTGASWEETKKIAKEFNAARGEGNWETLLVDDRVSPALGGFKKRESPSNKPNPVNIAKYESIINRLEGDLHEKISKLDDKIDWYNHYWNGPEGGIGKGYLRTPSGGIRYEPQLGVEVGTALTALRLELMVIPPIKRDTSILNKLIRNYRDSIEIEESK